MVDKATKHVSIGSTGLHSMQSLGWGAVAMQQLGQLINWSGTDSFKPVSVDPWTALTTLSTSVADTPTEPQDASPSSVETTGSDVDKLASEQASAERAAEEKAAADKAAADKAAADKAAADKAAADKAAADKAAAEKVAGDKAAQDQDAANKAAEDRASAEKAAADKAAADKAAADKAAADKAAADKAAADKAAADKAAAEKAAAEKAAAEKAAAEKAAAEKAAAEKAAAEKAAAAAIDALKQQSQSRLEAEPPPVKASRDDSPSVKPTTAPPAVHRDVRNVTPRQPETITAVATVPPPILQRPVSADSSVEDYLVRLEQLVLQLNMELGRRNQTSSDPIQDLSQRVIDLNLENLALKEQLRHSTGKHHE